MGNQQTALSGIHPFRDPNQSDMYDYQVPLPPQPPQRQQPYITIEHVSSGTSYVQQQDLGMFGDTILRPPPPPPRRASSSQVRSKSERFAKLMKLELFSKKLSLKTLPRMISRPDLSKLGTLLKFTKRRKFVGEIYPVPPDAEKPSPPSKPEVLQEQDEYFLVRWDPPAYDGGLPIIGYVIQHLELGLPTLDNPHQDDTQSWFSSEPGQVTSTEILLNNLIPGTTYQFRIIAENLLGYSQPGEISDPIVFNPNGELDDWFCPPVLIIPLDESYTVIEHERLVLNIEITGQPYPIVKWYDKDEMELSKLLDPVKYSTVSCGQTRTLTINCIQLSDAGLIKCIGENEKGVVETHCFVFVEAPPHIHRVQHIDFLRLQNPYELTEAEQRLVEQKALESTGDDEDLIFQSGELARLKFMYSGSPKPNVCVYHEGDLVDGEEVGGNRASVVGKRCSTEVTENLITVKIPGIRRADRGEWVVRLENVLGEDMAMVLITVTDRPSPPGKPDVLQLSDNTCILKWDRPYDDGGCPVQGYIVEYFRTEWGVWLKAVTTKNPYTKIRDLIPGSKYKFRVKAENLYGMSSPSDESVELLITDLVSTLRSVAGEGEASLLMKTVMEEEEEGVRIEEEQPSSAVDVMQLYSRPIRRKQDSSTSSLRVSAGTMTEFTSLKKTIEPRLSSTRPRSPIQLLPQPAQPARSPSPRLLQVTLQPQVLIIADDEDEEFLEPPEIQPRRSPSQDMSPRHKTMSQLYEPDFDFETPQERSMRVPDFEQTSPVTESRFMPMFERSSSPIRMPAFEAPQQQRTSQMRMPETRISERTTENKIMPIFETPNQRSSSPMRMPAFEPPQQRTSSPMRMPAFEPPQRSSSRMPAFNPPPQQRKSPIRMPTFEPPQRTSSPMRMPEPPQQQQMRMAENKLGPVFEPPRRVSPAREAPQQRPVAPPRAHTTPNVIHVQVGHPPPQQPERKLYSRSEIIKSAATDLNIYSFGLTEDEPVEEDPELLKVKEALMKDDLEDEEEEEEEEEYEYDFDKLQQEYEEDKKRGMVSRQDSGVSARSVGRDDSIEISASANVSRQNTTEEEDLSEFDNQVRARSVQSEVAGGGGANRVPTRDPFERAQSEFPGRVGGFEAGVISQVQKELEKSGKVHGIMDEVVSPPVVLRRGSRPSFLDEPEVQVEHELSLPTEQPRRATPEPRPTTGAPPLMLHDRFTDYIAMKASSRNKRVGSSLRSLSLNRYDSSESVQSTSSVPYKPSSRTGPEQKGEVKHFKSLFVPPPISSEFNAEVDVERISKLATSTAKAKSMTLPYDFVHPLQDRSVKNTSIPNRQIQEGYPVRPQKLELESSHHQQSVQSPVSPRFVSTPDIYSNVHKRSFTLEHSRSETNVDNDIPDSNLMQRAGSYLIVDDDVTEDDYSEGAVVDAMLTVPTTLVKDSQNEFLNQIREWRSESEMSGDFEEDGGREDVVRESGIRETSPVFQGFERETPREREDDEVRLKRWSGRGLSFGSEATEDNSEGGGGGVEFGDFVGDLRSLTFGEDEVRGFVEELLVEGLEVGEKVVTAGLEGEGKSEEIIVSAVLEVVREVEEQIEVEHSGQEKQDEQKVEEVAFGWDQIEKVESGEQIEIALENIGQQKQEEEVIFEKEKPEETEQAEVGEKVEPLRARDDELIPVEVVEENVQVAERAITEVAVEKVEQNPVEEVAFGWDQIEKVEASEPHEQIEAHLEQSGQQKQDEQNPVEKVEEVAFGWDQIEEVEPKETHKQIEVASEHSGQQKQDEQNPIEKVEEVAFGWDLIEKVEASETHEIEAALERVGLQKQEDEQNLIEKVEEVAFGWDQIEQIENVKAAKTGEQIEVASEHSEKQDEQNRIEKVEEVAFGWDLLEDKQVEKVGESEKVEQTEVVELNPVEVVEQVEKQTVEVPETTNGEKVVISEGQVVVEGELVQTEGNENNNNEQIVEQLEGGEMNVEQDDTIDEGEMVEEEYEEELGDEEEYEEYVDEGEYVEGEYVEGEYVEGEYVEGEEGEYEYVEGEEEEYEEEEYEEEVAAMKREYTPIDTESFKFKSLEALKEPEFEKNQAIEELLSKLNKFLSESEGGGGEEEKDLVEELEYDEEELGAVGGSVVRGNQRLSDLEMEKASLLIEQVVLADEIVDDEVVTATTSKVIEAVKPSEEEPEDPVITSGFEEPLLSVEAIEEVSVKFPEPPVEEKVMSELIELISKCGVKSKDPEASRQEPVITSMFEEPLLVDPVTEVISGQHVEIVQSSQHDIVIDGSELIEEQTQQELISEQQHVTQSDLLEVGQQQVELQQEIVTEEQPEQSCELEQPNEHATIVEAELEQPNNEEAIEQVVEEKVEHEPLEQSLPEVEPVITEKTLSVEKQPDLPEKLEEFQNEDRIVAQEESEQSISDASPKALEQPEADLDQIQTEEPTSLPAEEPVRRRYSVEPKLSRPPSGDYDQPSYQPMMSAYYDRAPSRQRSMSSRTSRESLRATSFERLSKSRVDLEYKPWRKGLETPVRDIQSDPRVSDLTQLDHEHSPVVEATAEPVQDIEQAPLVIPNGPPQPTEEPEDLPETERITVTADQQAPEVTPEAVQPTETPPVTPEPEDEPKWTIDRPSRIKSPEPDVTLPLTTLHQQIKQLPPINLSRSPLRGLSKPKTSSISDLLVEFGSRTELSKSATPTTIDRTEPLSPPPAPKQPRLRSATPVIRRPIVSTDEDPFLTVDIAEVRRRAMELEKQRDPAPVAPVDDVMPPPKRKAPAKKQPAEEESKTPFMTYLFTAAMYLMLSPMLLFVDSLYLALVCLLVVACVHFFIIML